MQRCTAHLVTSCIMSIRDVTVTKNLSWPYMTMTTHHYKHTTWLWLCSYQRRTKFEGSKMCHNWFWIDYFRLNFHLIMEILATICWRREFIIARPLRWEINRNSAVNYFDFVLSLIRIVYIFERVMLAHRHSDVSQYVHSKFQNQQCCRFVKICWSKLIEINQTQKNQSD